MSSEPLVLVRQVDTDTHVYEVVLNRPRKKNALSAALLEGIEVAFTTPPLTTLARCVVLTGAGSDFCSGIDLQTLAELAGNQRDDTARTAIELLHSITRMQRVVTAIETLRVPVVAAIQKGCIGAGLDIASAADVRYCSADAVFSIKEVAVGIAADLGVLQRLPPAVASSSAVREWAYTGRNITSQEALQWGLVSRVEATAEACRAAALALARVIASRSPVAVLGTKEALISERRYLNEQGLRNMAWMNGALLQSTDVLAAISGAGKQGQTPVFSKL